MGIYKYTVVQLNNTIFHASMSSARAHRLVERGNAVSVGTTYACGREEAVKKVLGTYDFQLAKLAEVNQLLLGGS